MTALRGAGAAVLVALAAAVPAVPAAELPLELRATQVFAAPVGVAPLVEVTGVVADALGQVWATDATGHRLVRWDAGGAWLDETGALGSDVNQFRRPTALARLGSLGVAVLDVENRRIAAWDLRGRRTDLVVPLAGSPLEATIGRVTPVALASDRGAALYVADSDRDRVLAFDFSGAFRRVLGGYGIAPGAFHGLAGLAVGSRGEIVTLERPLAPRRRKGVAPDTTTGVPARVQRLDAGGTPIASFTLDAAGAREFALAVDDSGRVAVALAGGREDEVRVYGRDGTLLARTVGFTRPRGAAFAPDGTLLVAEAGAARVRRFVLATVR